MTTLQRQQLNQISDTQWSWTPLRKIRQNPQEPLPARASFWTAVGFSGVLVAGRCGAALILAVPIDTPKLASTFVAWFLVGYLVHRLTFARAWHERAAESAQGTSPQQDALPTS